MKWERMTYREIKEMIESDFHCINEPWTDNIKRMIAVAEAVKEAGHCKEAMHDAPSGECRLCRAVAALEAE